MTIIPVTVISRSPAARSFVGCDLLPDEWSIDLRRQYDLAAVHSAVEGLDYLPGTYVERWHA